MTSRKGLLIKEGLPSLIFLLLSMGCTTDFMDEAGMAKSPFLESIASYMQVRNYSKRTIAAYLYWIKYFIVFCGKQHPRELGSVDIERFLTFLAVERHVSPSTQAVALNALVFLKTKFLSQSIEPLEHFQRANRQRKLPVVLTQEEVKMLLGQLAGVHYLMGGLLNNWGQSKNSLCYCPRASNFSYFYSDPKYPQLFLL